MADTAEFILKLNDQMSGPAKQAAAALRLVDANSNAATRSAEKLAAATRRMGLAQIAAQKMDEAHNKRQKEHSGFFGSFKEKLPFRSVGDYAKGAFWGDIAAEGAMKLGEGLIEGAHKAVEFLVEGVKKAFEEGGKAEDLRVSYRHLLGEKGGAEALENIHGFAGRTRFGEDQIASMMRPLFNAGLEGTGSRTAFALASDAHVRRGVDPSEIIEGLAKIQLKGGISEKLIEHLGVGVREFKDALAIETGSKDKEATFKLATEGKLRDPMAIQNAIVRATEKHFGTKTGTATEDDSKSMSARFAQLGRLPDEYLKKMSMSPEWKKLEDKLGETLEGLDPDGPRGKKIVAALFRVFDQLTTWARNALTPENIDKFAAGAEKAVDALTSLPGILDKLITGAEVFGMIFLTGSVFKGLSGAAGLVEQISINVAKAAAAGEVSSAAAAATAGTATAAAGGGSGAGGMIASLGGRALLGLAAMGLFAEPDRQAGAMAWTDEDVKAGRVKKVDTWSGTEYREVKNPAPVVKPADTTTPAPANHYSFGDINITGADTKDPKALATEFVKNMKEQTAKALGRAATEGGGGV